jgi:hypothetical protein
LSLGGAGGNQLTGQVQQVTYLGELLHVRVQAAGNTLLEVHSLPQGADRLRPGDAVVLTVPPQHVVILQDSP